MPTTSRFCARSSATITRWDPRAGGCRPADELYACRDGAGLPRRSQRALSARDGKLVQWYPFVYRTYTRSPDAAYPGTRWNFRSERSGTLRTTRITTRTFLRPSRVSTDTRCSGPAACGTHPVLARAPCVLKVRVYDSFGEDAFEVTMHPPWRADAGQRASFTAKQGQYLAFIFHYTKIHRLAPAESDRQKYFRVSPPSVHQMIVTLEKNGLIERRPGRARSIRVLVPAEQLPPLE
jgi:hypothetical protein